MLFSCIIAAQTIVVSGPLTAALFLVFSFLQPTRHTRQTPLIGPVPYLLGELTPANPRAPSSLYYATEGVAVVFTVVRSSLSRRFPRSVLTGSPVVFSSLSLRTRGRFGKSQGTARIWFV